MTLVQTGNSPSLHMVLLCTHSLKRALSSYKSLIDYVKNYCNSSNNTSDKDETEETEDYELEGQYMIGIKYFLKSNLSASQF